MGKGMGRRETKCGVVWWSYKRGVFRK